MDINSDLKEMRALLQRVRKRELENQIQDTKRQRTAASYADQEKSGEAKARLMFGFGADWTFASGEDEKIEEPSVPMILSGHPKPSRSVVTQEMQLEVLRGMLMRDADHVREIAALPQRSDAWLAARVHRLTGSKAGAAAGMNPYESPEALLASMVWPKPVIPNKAMKRGTLLEPYAAKSFLRKIRVDMRDPNAQLAIPGLVVSQAEPMLAYSPDGIVLFSDGARRLIEIKTPFKRKPYPSVPKMYICQMQLGMHLLNLESCYFVVYCGIGVDGCDNETFIQEIKRDRDFANNEMLPAMRKLFFRRYLPLVVCRDLGMLREGQLHVPHGVRVEYLDESVWSTLQSQ